MTNEPSLTPLYDEALAAIKDCSGPEFWATEPADPLEAIKHWLRVATNYESERQMSNIRLRAERRSSEVLREMAGLPPKGRRRKG